MQYYHRCVQDSLIHTLMSNTVLLPECHPTQCNIQVMNEKLIGLKEPALMQHI